MAKAKLSLFQLTQGTQKALPKALETYKKGISVKNIKVTNLIGTKTKLITARTSSSSSSEQYNTRINFLNLPRFDKKTLPSIRKTPVRVRCSCKSFYFWCIYPNKLHGALAGGQFKTYKRKTPPPSQGGRPETNPSKIPCLCKHLLLLVQELRKRKMITE